MSEKNIASADPSRMVPGILSAQPNTPEEINAALDTLCRCQAEDLAEMLGIAS